ncbi:MAG: hypothetical protein QNJ09_09435 [Paracoccaceae bacterium]|nr:hypothetical protein [Paracoccaceae bacterium]
MKKIAFLVAALAASPLWADEVIDSLDAAKEAYENGDIQFAIEELEYARQQLMAMKTDSLGAFLPEAPNGWTREIDNDMAAGLAMMGGGVGAEAEYSGPGGKNVSLTLMADNPMVASMGAMAANAAMMGMKVERINRQRFAIQDDQMMALVANRILIQAEGDLDAARMILEQIDFKALADFGN